MVEIPIRKMAPSELEDVVGVWVRSRWASEPWLEQRMGYSDADNLSYMRDVIVRDFDIWLALDGPRIAGLLALSNGHVDQLFVEPELQRMGFGSALLRKAKALSPGGLTLYTHQRNEGARRFYEKQGFRAVRFGVSPPPESEPDVTYTWDGTAAPRVARDGPTG